MSRRIQSLLALVVVAFVFAAAACSNATGPQPASHLSADQNCDWQNNGTCH
jgi:invasion protein IalB